MQLLWRPSPAKVERANLTRFLEFLSEARGVSLRDYLALYSWSVENPEEFWAAFWEFSGIRASKKWGQVLDDRTRMPGAKWFSEARLNFAENLLREDSERQALVFWNERGRQRSVSFRELYRQVSGLAQSLKANGVGPGDRVAGYLPNLIETVVAMLSTASLGAAWSSCSPDFGVKGVLDRFGQIQPRILFAADGYVYAGKPYQLGDRVAAILAQIPEIEKCVIVPYPRDSIERKLSGKEVAWGDFVAGPSGSIPFEQVPFDHPLYIMYSSGTTGLPKCMVHGVGGTLIQHLKELQLHTNLTSRSRIFYYTTCGWMMWNWLVSSLASGATVVLYEGSPFHPNDGILFDLAEKEQVTVFGTSAKYLAMAEKNGLKPAESHDLSSLETILSTGSPLAPSSFDYVYRDIKYDVCLSSISGGTDIISCFALGNPVGPVYRGELQTRGLGMKVEVFDDAGNSLVGSKGELVCTMAFPSMPVCFWNDKDGRKYRKAYFDHFPGVWRHGDWAELTEHGGMIIYGRSDATLNPGGVRIGTAEIYRVVDQMPEILESIVIGQQWQGDVRIVLFVRLRGDKTLDEDLTKTIRDRIRSATTPHHVPRKVIQVSDIPRTISGKISEVAVGRIVHGQPVENLDALANPNSLEFFRNLPELED